MANHKSAAKRARQTIVRTARNAQTKSAVRTYEKKLRSAIDEKDAEKSSELLKTFSSKLGKAAKRGVFHKSMASRKVSRLSAQVHAISK